MRSQDEDNLLKYLDHCSVSKYASPYLTCRKCNSINFIDVTAIKGIANMWKATTTSFVYELLPSCCGCGKTKFLYAGASNFQEHIGQQLKHEETHATKCRPAAINIQVRIRASYLS
jgi:hypothetical protein